MTDHDLDTLLADFHNDVPAMTEDAFQSGRARLEGVVDSGHAEPLEPVSITHAPERARHGPRRRFLQLAAAAAAVVAVGATVTLVRGDTDITPATVNSPATLAEWARGLADNPPLFGPGQYRYEHLEYARTSDTIGDSTMTSDMWIPYDFHDEWQRNVTAMKDIYGPDLGTQRAKCGNFPSVLELINTNDGEAEKPKLCEGNGVLGFVSPAYFAKWTGDPQKLYDQIHSQAVGRGPGLSAEIFVQAGPLLGGYLPNDFRATLFEALSKTPGLVVLNHATTRDGRDGIGLRVTSADTTELWILDRKTGDPIETRETSDFSDSQATFTYGVTDRIGVRPAR